MSDDDITSYEIWEEELAKHPEANFLQSPAWADVNNQIRHQVYVLIQADGTRILTIVKNAKRGRYLEVPGGPLIDWENKSERQEAFEALTQLAKAKGCAFVRFRPQLPKTEHNLALMEQFGARPASFHLHAEHTVILDLTQPEADLLANMRRQTRYEVRRAKKLGIKVTKSRTSEVFETFHAIQAETAKRQHFIPPTLRDLLAYRQAFASQAQIYTARTTDQDIIAMGLIISHGLEADYFEAASTELNRHLPGAYALLWQAIRDAKRQGYERFNLWGIAPPDQPHHRYAGVTTFKTGFGGKITEYVPAQDIVINKHAYAKTRAIETVRKKIRRLK